MTAREFSEYLTKSNNSDMLNAWSYILENYSIKDIKKKILFGANITVSQLATYDAKKVYLCSKLIIGKSIQQPFNNPSTNLHDITNAVFLSLQNLIAYWDTLGAVANYYSNNIILNNIFFSRISNSGYSPNFYFSGFEITLN